VDRWDDELQEDENIWTIEDSVLTLFSPTEETPRQCAFQMIEGQIIGFSTMMEEPTEPIEPAEEPSTEEPAVEPAGELTDEASSEPKIGAGGCQMGANGKNLLPLWLGLLGLLGFRRQNIVHPNYWTACEGGLYLLKYQKREVKNGKETKNIYQRIQG